MHSGDTQKNILVLLGSPRKKGNSAALAQHIIRGAESCGAITDTVYLNGMKIGPCQACYSCRKPGSSGCVVDDDMQTLYPKLQSSDTWVIASPVYWFSVSAQTKLFMDRCFAMFNETVEKNQLLNKQIAIAMSYGDSDAFNSGCVNALRTFQDTYNYVGAKIVGMVYGSAYEPGEIETNTLLIDQAEELGRKLAHG